jgi:YD repeat-containing protein
VSIKFYDGSGALAGSVTTVYSPRGQVLKQKEFSSSGALISIKLGGASEQGWRVVETVASGAVLSIEDTTLGPHGELVSVTVRNGRETPLSVVEYQYDQAGRLSASLTRAGDGRLKTRTVYTYDRQGNNTKTEVYDGSGALNNVFERQFDGNRLVVEKGYDASGVVVELTKTTWKDGRRLVQETVTPVNRTTEFSYNGTDVPVALVKSVRGQVVERQTFEYQ